MQTDSDRSRVFDYGSSVIRLYKCSISVVCHLRPQIPTVYAHIMHMLITTGIAYLLLVLLSTLGHWKSGPIGRGIGSAYILVLCWGHERMYGPAETDATIKSDFDGVPKTNHNMSQPLHEQSTSNLQQRSRR